VLDPEELDLLQSVARPLGTAADSPSCPPDPT